MQITTIVSFFVLVSNQLLHFDPHLVCGQTVDVSFSAGSWYSRSIDTWVCKLMRKHFPFMLACTTTSQSLYPFAFWNVKTSAEIPLFRPLLDSPTTVAGSRVYLRLIFKIPQLTGHFASIDARLSASFMTWRDLSGRIDRTGQGRVTSAGPGRKRRLAAPPAQTGTVYATTVGMR